MRSISRRDHPRSRGENDDGDRRERLQGGSSPLTRGKRRVPRRRVLREGIIPAHAGKTYDGLIPALRSGDHPRSRGENIAPCFHIARDAGSSPLTRGKCPGRGPHRRGRRIIPAHAGKTSTPSRAPAPSKDHPRSRGENIKAAVSVVVEWGSSPLTRGKLISETDFGKIAGIIPAHAGKTTRVLGGAGSWRDHPRSRGENLGRASDLW